MPTPEISAQRVLTRETPTNPIPPLGMLVENPAPPTLPESLLDERAKKAIEKLNNHHFNQGIPLSYDLEARMTLTTIGQELQMALLQDQPHDGDMELSIKKHEEALNNIRRGIMTNAKYASQFLEDPQGFRGASLKNLQSTVAEGERLQAIEEIATRIVWKKTDPTRSEEVLDIYQNEPKTLPFHVQKLLKTAKNYLVAEAYPERDELENKSNVWEKLVDMYNTGMHDLTIDPSNGWMQISITMNYGDKTGVETFTVPPPNSSSG